MKSRRSHPPRFPLSWLLIAIIVAVFSGAGALVTHATITVSGSSITGDSAFDAFTVPGSPPASSSTSLLELGPNAINNGSPSGTFIGVNPTSFSGDFLDFQVDSSTEFKVDGSGNLTASTISVAELDSSGAISIIASGTDQDITLTPSGIGDVVIGKNGLRFPDNTVQSTAAGTGQITAYYVDSVNGSDSNSGTSPLAAWKTLSHAQSAVTWGPGMTLYLARGSVWHAAPSDATDAVLHLQNVSGLTIKAYGSGQSPIIDAAAVAPNASFSLQSGDTYTYQISWANNMILSAGTSASAYFKVWEDSGNGFRQLHKQSSIANVESNSCSYYAPALTATAATAAIYVHACDSSDVATNGYTYEISEDNAGAWVGNYATVEGIHFRFASGGGRNLNGGDNNYWKDDTFEYAQIHSAIIGSGIVDHCLFWQTDNDSTDTSQLVIYRGGSGAGYTQLIENSTFIGGDPWNPDASATDNSTAVGGHTGPLDEFDSVVFKNDTFDNFGAGISGPGKTFVVENCIFKRIAGAATGPNTGTGFTSNVTIANNFFDGSNPTGPSMTGAFRVLNALPGKEMIYGNLIVIRATTYGAIYSISPTSLVAQNNTFIEVNRSNAGVTALDAPAGIVTWNNNIIEGLDYPLNVASGVTFSADYNIYYSRALNTGAAWNVLGTNYNTFAAYQSGTGQDTHGAFQDALVRYDEGTGTSSIPPGSWAAINHAGATFADASLESQLVSQFLGYQGPIALPYAPGTDSGSQSSYTYSSIAGLDNVSAQSSDSGGKVTLSSGTYTVNFTAGKYRIAPYCVATDISAKNPVQLGIGASSLIINGVASDSVVYLCVPSD